MSIFSKKRDLIHLNIIRIIYFLKIISLYSGEEKWGKNPTISTVDCLC